jgi:hypothetical protein
MVFFRPKVENLYSRRKVRGLIKALKYKKDESIREKAKEYLIELGKEAGEAIVQEYESLYHDRPMEDELLEGALVEICKRNDSTVERINDVIIASRDSAWLRENLEDVLVKAGEKAIRMLIREADRRGGGIPLVEGTLRKMGEIAVGPLSEVAREGVKYPREVRRILQEIQGSPIDFEVKNSVSKAPALFGLVEATAFRTAMSRCSPEDLDLLRLKIRNARERGADLVEVTSFLPEIKNKVKIDELEKTLDDVLAEMKAREKKKGETSLESTPLS